MAIWLNESGLAVKFGSDEAVKTQGGEYNHLGPERCIELDVRLSDLTQTETVLADNVVIPNGAMITKVVVDSMETAATGTAIDIGTVKLDRTTEIDYDGYLAAFATASMAVGNKIEFRQNATVPLSVTGTGADIGELVAFPSLISGSRTDGTAFTAGIIRITIYFIPNALTY